MREFEFRVRSVLLVGACALFLVLARASLPALRNAWQAMNRPLHLAPTLNVCLAYITTYGPDWRERLPADWNLPGDSVQGAVTPGIMIASFPTSVLTVARKLLRLLAIAIIAAALLLPLCGV